jgi:hypothetical protein
MGINKLITKGGNVNTVSEILSDCLYSNTKETPLTICFQDSKYFVYPEKVRKHYKEISELAHGLPDIDDLPTDNNDVGKVFVLVIALARLNMN